MYRAAKRPRLSQLDVERRAKLTRGQYWRIENEADDATDSELRRIARVLGVAFDGLVCREQAVSA